MTRVCFATFDNTTWVVLQSLTTFGVVLHFLTKQRWLTCKFRQQNFRLNLSKLFCKSFDNTTYVVLQFFDKTTLVVLQILDETTLVVLQFFDKATWVVLPLFDKTTVDRYANF